ncbi:MAG: hypothetical protein P4L43_08950 [Syntrophobacteraceae bacterium]|nr:hypothetical protein [Syntrophobacteraceae bacterium]
MKSHPRLTGLCFLLISMRFFLTTDLDKGGGVLGLCGFLLFFVSGWLVLIFFWNDGDIKKLRRIHKDKNRDSAFPAVSFQEKTFRYREMRGARLAVMVCLSIFMFAMAMASLYFLLLNKNTADAATMDTLFFVSGLFALCTLFLCWLTWRYGHVFIRVEGKGIAAFTYLGMRHADWEDIVALRDWIPFRGWGAISDLFTADFSLYKIYTHNQMITFSSSMPEASELARLISETTGLDWT